MSASNTPPTPLLDVYQEMLRSGFPQAAGAIGLVFGFIPESDLAAAVAAGFNPCFPPQHAPSTPGFPGAAIPATPPSTAGAAWDNMAEDADQEVIDELEGVEDSSSSSEDEEEERGVYFPGTVGHKELTKGSGKHQCKPGSVLRGGREPWAKGGGKRARPGSVLRGGRNPEAKKHGKKRARRATLPLDPAGGLHRRGGGGGGGDRGGRDPPGGSSGGCGVTA
jgi:hypothetical protein